MSDALFELVATYGVWLLAAACFLSCLLVPIPSSLLMLAGGAFVAAGDLEFVTVFASAWLAAVAGDQTGYAIGRGGAPLLDRLAERRPNRADLIARARALVARRGGLGVFFSTWLVAPLGPYVNFVAGASGLGWLRFTLWDAAGEAIWAGGYIGLGYGFADHLVLVADFAANASGFLVAAAVALGLGWLLRARLRKARARALST
ncbi:DedA family protein [Marinovum sp.]|uniref:DedA family protein n=1 Tax=Marinovum sp. TaxID=2024839 RepID=UPI002B2753DB|nr:DedA family protein [Marinovum sp.]